MKENIENTIKKPWFAQLFDKLNSLRIDQIILSAVVIGAILLLGAYGYFKSQPTVPYEDVYDMAFYNYANEELENVIHEISDEEGGINLKKIPENVSEFNIFYTKEGITINYCLDNNMIIPQYNSETGRNTTQHSFEEELRISIRMSNEFECIEKTSFLIDEIPSHEEYQKENNKIMIQSALLLAFLALMVIIVIYEITMLILLITVSIWENVHKKAEE